jgi:alkanesulfonate monooxygenase SsuD/methylene tetrahydromethanopterin reductase-like flavin-dependent oxidoreductase (luciferase family)
VTGPAQTPEFFLFLPQMRMTMPELAERARRAEAAGFHGIALMDHLAPPLAEDKSMYEAMTTAMWLAANTSTLRIGHLVLCDAVRAPAVLAREAVAIDHASGGRFELGIGAGSVPAEFKAFGIPTAGLEARLRRLVETLDVLNLLWSGERVDYDGEFHHLSGAQQVPAPIDRIPIVLGGKSDAIVAAASKYADWWNLPLINVDSMDELQPRVRPARTSLQVMSAYVASEGQREETVQLAQRRFGHMNGSGFAIGDGRELCERFTALHERGVERFYVWFSDFASDATLDGFGGEVIATLSRT